VIAFEATVFQLRFSCDYSTPFDVDSLFDASKKERIDEDDDINTQERSNTLQAYLPGKAEQYVLDHMTELGYHQALSSDKNVMGAKSRMHPAHWTSGCGICKKDAPVYSSLKMYQSELQEYNRRLDQFTTPFQDIRLHLDQPNVCDRLKLHPDGLAGIFNASGEISHSTNSGWIEPMIPPFRHHLLCSEEERAKNLMNMKYLVHDFETMCRKLKRTSRTILIDMGASLFFHGAADQPAVYLIELYRKFGLPFDHIYAFEMKATEPLRVFRSLPDHMRAAYHWINVGVSADKNSSLNPLKMLLDNFNEDDLIVIKLDIDTPAIEVPLAKQIVEDERLARLIDQFYFEYHVFQREVLEWGRLAKEGRLNDTIKDSMDLFTSMRFKGTAAHSWV